MVHYFPADPVALESHLDEAYAWLCRQRRHHPSNADIWHLRFHREQERQSIIDELTTGQFHFSPLTCIHKHDGETLHLWAARDALVLKMLSWYLSQRLPISSACTHIKGHGGLKFAIRDVDAHLACNKFVIRTDVKAFYQSIHHHLLLERLAVIIKDRIVLNLLWQSIHRCVERGGVFRDITQGIPRGCPLSPLLGAFFLTELDQAFETRDVFYVRYMDDILIMTKNRWALRKAIKRLNVIFNHLKLEKHPDKTFIGRIEKGFDFLGYHFSREGLSLAAKTITNAKDKLRRLYEQNETEPEGSVVIDEYCRRWRSWVSGGLSQHNRSKIIQIIDELGKLVKVYA